jgi:hypothetical protein
MITEHTLYRWEICVIMRPVIKRSLRNNLKCMIHTLNVSNGSPSSWFGDLSFVLACRTQLEDWIRLKIVFTGAADAIISSRIFPTFREICGGSVNWWWPPNLSNLLDDDHRLYLCSWSQVQQGVAKCDFRISTIFHGNTTVVLFSTADL